MNRLRDAVSPSAWRSFVTRFEIASSDTMRPSQSSSINSLLLTTWGARAINSPSNSSTRGCTLNSSPLRASSRRSQSKVKSSKRYLVTPAAIDWSGRNSSLVPTWSGLSQGTIHESRLRTSDESCVVWRSISLRLGDALRLMSVMLSARVMEYLACERVQGFWYAPKDVQQ